ncbi:MAG: hypothetical protein ACOYXT_18605 [Bacteroidota bacterium]
MKTVNILILFFLLCAGLTLAQNIPVTKTSRLSEDQVPVAIRQSLKNNFASVSEGGFWTVHFNTTTENGRTVAKPLWYSYNNKKSSQKVVISYDAAGKLRSVKGATKGETASEPSREKTSGDQDGTGL